MLAALLLVGFAGAREPASNPASRSAPEFSLSVNSTPNSTPLNNTTSHLAAEVGAFVHWFTEGLAIVIGFVVVVLLFGGILNYVLVGRNRPRWSPAEADGLRASRPSPPTAPARDGPPEGPR